MKEGDVRADVFLDSGEKIIMTTNYLNQDSGKAWKITLPGNSHSFEDVYKKNLNVDIAEAFGEAAKAHATFRKNL